MKNVVIVALIVLTGWMLYQQNFTEKEVVTTEEMVVLEASEAEFSVAETSLTEIPKGKGRVNFPKVQL